MNGRACTRGPPRGGGSCLDREGKWDYNKTDVLNLTILNKKRLSGGIAMPPKPKFARREIVEAALDLVSRRGP